MGRPFLTDAPVTLTLSVEEALVLFDLLARFEATDELQLDHSAEHGALWSLLALLEKQMVEPFSAEYHIYLDGARAKLVERYGLGNEP
ncbi:MAG: hypothetical protein AAGF99_11830 [Bacteroidota bacterium]